ncbi:MAG: fibronectin type III domain-containing protein [Lachnospiraceae bacterium]|nr:fibronectin type III domain-containing protein [Lachnospiraceae bacterium]
MKIRYRKVLHIILAAAVAASSAALPYSGRELFAGEEYFIVEESGAKDIEDAAPDADPAAGADSEPFLQDVEEDAAGLLPGEPGQNTETTASPFDPEDPDALSSEETEAEVQTGAGEAETGETGADAKPLPETDADSGEEAGIPDAAADDPAADAAGSEEDPAEGTEETESELLESAEEVTDSTSVYITAKPGQQNSKYTLYCTFYLQKDGEEDWSVLKTDPAGALYKAGAQCTISGLEYGTDYRIKVSVPHYSDSREYQISISEDGTVYIDGSRTEYLTLTLSVARYMAKSDLTKISLTGLNKISRPAALEGGTATKSFLLSAFLAGTDALNQLALLSLKDYSLIRTQAAKYALEHANDMTYIESLNRIYVMPMDHTNRVILLNGTTLAFEGELVLGQNYHAVAWDETSGCFFCVYEGPDGIICDVLDSDMTKVIRSFPILTNLTYQGAAAYNSMLYYTCWERGSTSGYQAVYDGVLKANDNVIYVYDIYGNLCKTYYIEGGSSKSELETLSFVGGRMILQFNESGSKAGYYRVDPIPASVRLSVPVTQNGKPAADGAYTAVLKRNGKKEKELKCSAGAFTAPKVSITEPGSYTFTISEKKGSSPDKYVYDTAAVSFTVTAVYDPYTNALTTKVSAPSRAKITNTKLTKAQRRKIRKLRKQRVSVLKAKGKSSVLKLKWKKIRFGKSAVSGYRIQICRNKQFSGSTLQTFNTAGTSLTVRGLTAGKTWYVRIRACRKVGVKTFCSKWSVRKKVRIFGG